MEAAELRGHSPPPCTQNGGIRVPLLSHGAVSPNNVPENKREVRVLCMDRGGLASASELKFRLASCGTREHLSRTCFPSPSPAWLQKAGVYALF